MGRLVPLIKWPNDLLVDGAKLAGVLLERAEDAVVVGVGANLAWAPKIEGRLTISLAALGHQPSLERWSAVLAAAFAAELARWRQEGLAATIARWTDRAHPQGTALTISDGALAGLTGRFDGLERDGGLRLRSEDGRVTVVRAGEVAVSPDPAPDSKRGR